MSRLKNTPLKLIGYQTNKIEESQEEVSCLASIEINGESKSIQGQGNGPINAFVHALESEGLKDFKESGYSYDPALSTETTWTFTRPQS